jgi:hypothetical protein
MKNGLKIVLFTGVFFISSSLLGMMNLEESIKDTIEAELDPKKADWTVRSVQAHIDDLDSKRIVSDTANLVILIKKIFQLKAKGDLQDVDSATIKQLIEKFFSKAQDEANVFKFQLENLK